jgi:hypothetical protein
MTGPSTNHAWSKLERYIARTDGAGGTSKSISFSCACVYLSSIRMTNRLRQSRQLATCVRCRGVIASLRSSIRELEAAGWLTDDIGDDLSFSSSCSGLVVVRGHHSPDRRHSCGGLGASLLPAGTHHSGTHGVLNSWGDSRAAEDKCSNFSLGEINVDPSVPARLRGCTWGHATVCTRIFWNSVCTRIAWPHIFVSFFLFRFQ